jgi:hypothetical protein
MLDLTFIKDTIAILCHFYDFPVIKWHSMKPLRPAQDDLDQQHLNLVPPERDDPYQDHTSRPHCEEHFLFTQDCAACQDILQAQPAKLHPVSRSFGFTDDVHTAALTPNANSFGPTPKNAALESLPEMILKAQEPYKSPLHAMMQREIVNSAVDAIVDFELDLFKND